MPNFENFNPTNPEKPKEEPIKQESEKIEEGPKAETESEVEYNKEEWEEIKSSKGPVSAIEKGRALGVPEEEIERFAREIIEREKSDPAFVLRFMRNMGIGTEEELKSAEERAREYVIKKEAEEKKTESKKEKNRKEKTEKEGIVKLSKDATFVDLFEAIDASEEKEEEVHFEEELLDNFDKEVVGEILYFRNNPGEAAKTKVADFFRKHGFLKSDITTYLPIKFKK